MRTHWTEHKALKIEARDALLSSCIAIDRPLRTVTLPANENQSNRIIVRIVFSRVALLDFDNLHACPKFLLDQLRYLKFIPEDNPETIEGSVAQTKVRTEKEQGALLEITYPPNMRPTKPPASQFING
jgi:hypothetical protein